VRIDDAIWARRERAKDLPPGELGRMLRGAFACVQAGC
jgi:hypothetical protein